jgi:hypothetical protein
MTTYKGRQLWRRTRFESLLVRPLWEAKNYNSYVFVYIHGKSDVCDLPVLRTNARWVTAQLSAPSAGGGRGLPVDLCGTYD